MITPVAPPLGTSTSAVTECDLFLRLRTEFSLSRRHPLIQQLRVALHQDGSAGDVRVEALDAPVVEGKHVVLDRLDQPEALKLPQLVGVLGGQVVGL